MSLTRIITEVVVDSFDESDLARAAIRAQALAEKQILDEARMTDLVVTGRSSVVYTDNAWRTPTGLLRADELSLDQEAELADELGLAAPNALVLVFAQDTLPRRTFERRLLADRRAA